jgi:hypothetical protein
VRASRASATEIEPNTGEDRTKKLPGPSPNLAVAAEDTPATHRTQLPSSYYETATDLLRASHIGSSSAATADHIVIINTV